MNNIIKKPLQRLGYDFIDQDFLPNGKDEYYIRDSKWLGTKKYRGLIASEIEVLVKNSNTSDDWNAIKVTDKFNPNLVKRCSFYGLVRIGALEPYLLEYHGIQLQVGLYDSTIVSCDLGDNVVINKVNHMAHYQVGDESILLNINELVTTSAAKFGTGVLKQGESDQHRVWLELCNENTGRKVLPFESMLAGDAYMWSKFRDDKELLDKFQEFTEKEVDDKRGHYGSIGIRTIIKNCKIIKDVKIGDDAYIKGANKLKNLTIKSSPEASTQIGEGVEMVNGIVGFGCRAFYGVKAVRFILGSHSSLKYGARLINSYLGNNATISCCEVLNTLIFPGHEQHHNNSFLCAALIGGQSNIAAGATIGSNHNSRGNDGEVVAGRGFWPGLCVSLKHNSSFASFTLLAKGDYPAEINISLPFALVGNDESDNSIKILPAYWFEYNMYALARNTWKYNERDKRLLKIQRLDFDFLAPDTIQEIIGGIASLEKWVGESYSRENNLEESDYSVLGKQILEDQSVDFSKLKVLATGLENSKREVVILKPKVAYNWYKRLITFYLGKNLITEFENKTGFTIDALNKKTNFGRPESWVNVGGQFIREDRLSVLKENIKSGIIDSWEKVHASYKVIGDKYDKDKLSNALSSFAYIFDYEEKDITVELLKSVIKESIGIKKDFVDCVYDSRKKDYINEFRKMPYDNQEEMDAVVGKFEDNEFVAYSKQEFIDFEKSANELIKQL